jgi:isopentenyl diphosphate isomerase/L-lactate dehydrogenase-like FMN-dependent dehydrogenase
MIGTEVAMPVALAPTGLTGMQHADGEIKPRAPPNSSACRSRSRR